MMDDDCQICGQFVETIVRFHADEPFVDGRCYNLMCHACASVPRTWKENPDGEIIWYGYKSPDRLASVQDMITDGWTKREADISIKAVKKLLKNPRIIVVPEHGIQFFECLFLGDNKLYELSM